MISKASCSRMLLTTSGWCLSSQTSIFSGLILSCLFCLTIHDTAHSFSKWASGRYPCMTLFVGLSFILGRGRQAKGYLPLPLIYSGLQPSDSWHLASLLQELLICLNVWFLPDMFNHQRNNKKRRMLLVWWSLEKLLDGHSQKDYKVR